MSKRFSKAKAGDVFIVGKASPAIGILITKPGCKVVTKRAFIRFDRGQVYSVRCTQPRKRMIWVDSEIGRTLGLTFDQAYEIGSVYPDRLRAEIALAAGWAA